MQDRRDEGPKRTEELLWGVRPRTENRNSLRREEGRFKQREGHGQRQDDWQVWEVFTRNGTQETWGGCEPKAFSANLKSLVMKAGGKRDCGIFLDRSDG